MKCPFCSINDHVGCQNFTGPTITSTCTCGCFRDLISKTTDQWAALAGEEPDLQPGDSVACRACGVDVAVPPYELWHDLTFDEHGPVLTHQTCEAHR